MWKQYTAAGYCRIFLHSWQGRNPMLPELKYCSHATLPTTIRDRLHWVYQSPLMEHIGSAWTCYDFLNVGHIRCKFRHIIAHMILDWPDYYLGSARERLWLGKTQLLPSKMNVHQPPLRTAKDRQASLWWCITMITISRIRGKRRKTRIRWMVVAMVTTTITICVAFSY